MNIFKYTSQDVKRYSERVRISIPDAERALMTKDVRASIEEFRRTKDTDLLAEILQYIVEQEL